MFSPRFLGSEFQQQIALKEHDMKQFYLIRRDIFELRNLYAVLTDLLHKNIAKVNEFSKPNAIDNWSIKILKIRIPKGNNGGSMY